MLPTEDLFVFDYVLIHDLIRAGATRIPRLLCSKCRDRSDLRVHRVAHAARTDPVLDITAKVPHVFQSFTGALDEAGEALDRAAFFLRRSSAPDHACYAQARDRKDGKRAALSEARKIIRQACHILAGLGDDALSAA